MCECLHKREQSHDREDLIVRTGVTGDNRLPSDLDQIHCVTGGVSGTNCAFSSTVSSHCQWGLSLLIHPTVIHCIKFRINNMCTTVQMGPNFTQPKFVYQAPGTLQPSPGVLLSGKCTPTYSQRCMRTQGYIFE